MRRSLALLGVLILGGSPQVWENWRDAGSLPNIYTRLVHRDESPRTGHGSGPIQPTPPPGTYFAGGYAYPPRTLPVTRRRRWWHRRVRK